MKKPVSIGIRYRPASFEVRKSDGGFSSYNRPLTYSEEIIQTVMIGKDLRKKNSAWVYFAIAGACSLFTWGLQCQP